MKITKTKKHYVFLLIAIAMFSQTITNAQWTNTASNFPQLQRGFTEMIAVNSQVAWGLAYERNHAFSTPMTDFTRTTDGGNSWIAGHIASMPDQFIVGMEPQNGTTAFFLAAGFDFVGKVLKTTDGGVSWTQLTVAPFPMFYMNIHFFNANDGVVMGDTVLTGKKSKSYIAVFTTNDGGNTWTQVPKANLANHSTPEQFYPWSMCAVGNTIWTVSTKARVWKSIDKGLHWAAYQTPDNKAIVSQIKMRDALHGLWGISDELYRTTDGGITWTEIHPTGTYFTFDLAYVPGTASTYISTGGDTSKFDTNGGTGSLHGIGSSYSTDDGNSWITIDTAVDHLAIDMVNTTTGFCGGFNTSSSNGVFKYTGPAFSPRLSNNEITEDYSLSAFPNSFQASTTISFTLVQLQKVCIKIFDVNGRLVSILADKVFEAGKNEIIWNANDAKAGIYFLKMQSNDNLQTEKLILTK
jgi:photosystem II stability/assembly factor-like uncharacterized protein